MGKAVEGRAETSYVVRLDRGGAVELDQFSSYAMLTGSTFNGGVPLLQVLHAGAGRVHPAGFEQI